MSVSGLQKNWEMEISSDEEYLVVDVNRLAYVSYQWNRFAGPIYYYHCYNAEV